MEDRATNTEHRRYQNTRDVCWGLTVKDILNSIGQLLLPLLLAIFTVVITLSQQNENRQLRMEDRRLSDEQRYQDLNISRQQRFEDRELARDQREQDLNISREQREIDKWIAEQQRLHDKQLAAEKRAADDLNAAIQRNMTRDQRLYEINIEQERYKKEHEKYLDTLLLAYYNEIGELFQRTNEKPLSSNRIIFSLAKAKTLNVIEQIGSVRAAHLLMFLYGTGQLSIGVQSLELREARLNHIDLKNQRSLIDIYLAGAYLNNASFAGQNISYANFENAHLDGANFSRSICIGTIFNGASLIEADFSYAFILNASFIEVDLRNATFFNATGKNVHYEYARMQRTNFSHVHFDYIPDYFNPRGFIDSNLADSDFSRAYLPMSRFSFCNMTRINFTNSFLHGSDLTGSIMSYAVVDHTELGQAILAMTNLSCVNLSTIECYSVQSNLSSCRLGVASSLENAFLPNRTIGLPTPNLLQSEGYPNCSSITLGDTALVSNKSHWKINPLHSVVYQYRLIDENYLAFAGCFFVPTNISQQVEMKQTIDLSRFYAIISLKRARATVKGLMGYDTRVMVTQYDQNKKLLASSDSIVRYWSELLRSTAKSLEISIEFYNPLNKQFSWCHHIELHIEPDFYAPDTYLLNEYKSKY